MYACVRCRLPFVIATLRSWPKVTSNAQFTTRRRVTRPVATGSLSRVYNRSVHMSSDVTPSSAGAAVVYVTVPSQEVGEKLAGLLVNPENRLAACVNIVPGLTSIYWWDGKVNKDAELLLIIKTRTSLVPKLTEVVKSNHPYDECEVISLPVTGGSPSYIQWIHDSTSG